MYISYFSTMNEPDLAARIILAWLWHHFHLALESNPRPSGREPSALPLDHSFRSNRWSLFGASRLFNFDCILSWNISIEVVVHLEDDAHVRPFAELGGRLSIDGVSDFDLAGAILVVPAALGRVDWLVCRNWRNKVNCFVKMNCFEKFTPLL